MITKIKEYPITRPQDLPQHSVFFDIETTGLNPAFDQIILITCGYWEKNNHEEKFYIQQFFSDAGEKEIIDAFLHLLDQKKSLCLISYNGNAFDIPFLNKRMDRWNRKKTESMFLNSKIRKKIPKIISLDLLIRGKKLAEIEKEWNISTERNTRITNKDISDLYRAFKIKTKENKISSATTTAEIILKHGRSDVLVLPHLCQIGLTPDSEEKNLMRKLKLPRTITIHVFSPPLDIAFECKKNPDSLHYRFCSPYVELKETEWHDYHAKLSINGYEGMAILPLLKINIKHKTKGTLQTCIPHPKYLLDKEIEHLTNKDIINLMSLNDAQTLDIFLNTILTM